MSAPSAGLGRPPALAWRRRLSHRRFALGLLLVAALALAARVLFLAQFPAGIQIASVDGRGYHTLAVNLLAGRGFSLNTQPPFVPDAIRTPLYPALIALIYALGGVRPLNIAVAQAGLDALTAVLLALAVRRLTGRGRLGLAAGVLHAVNPISWRFANEALTETLLAAVLAWLLLAYGHYRHEGRGRWLALVGVAAGAALLVKPNVVLLPAIAAGAALLAPARAWPRRARAALAVLAIALAVVFPWIVRNRVVFGRWFLSHAFENNLARVSAVATLARAQNRWVEPWTPTWEALYSGLLAEAQARYGDAFYPSPRTAAEADLFQRQMAAVAGGVVRQHPRAFLAAHLDGFLRSWVPHEHQFWYERLSGQPWGALGSETGVVNEAVRRWRAGDPRGAWDHIWQERFVGLPPLGLALWLGWLLAYAGAALLIARGTWRLRGQPDVLWLGWAAVLYTTFLPGPIADVRFQVPVMPLLLALLAAGLGRGPTAPRQAATGTE